MLIIGVSIEAIALHAIKWRRNTSLEPMGKTNNKISITTGKKKRA
jgi:hypothetical protein